MPSDSSDNFANLATVSKDQMLRLWPFKPNEHMTNGETWYEVGRSKAYTSDDVGHNLKLECVALDVTMGLSFAPAITLITGCVIPAPSPTPRCLIPVNGYAVVYKKKTTKVYTRSTYVIDGVMRVKGRAACLIDAEDELLVTDLMFKWLPTYSL